MKKELKYRILAMSAALTVTIICFVITLLTGIETTVVKTIGAFVSVIIISVVLYKFPLWFYICALAFDLFAAALGSVINLYMYIGFYDRFVHYLSGILLAQAGILIINWVVKKRKIVPDKIIMIMFAFFFSAACAGFWEIYEFTADQLLNIDMQGSNLNTMGDIVSGVLGAATYTIVYLIYLVRLVRKNKVKQK